MNPTAFVLPILVSLMSFTTGADTVTVAGKSPVDGSDCMLNLALANGRVLGIQYRGLFIDQNDRPLLRRQLQFGGKDFCNKLPLQFPVRSLKEGVEILIPSVCVNYSLDSDYEREYKNDREAKRTRYDVAIYGDLKNPTGFFFQETGGQTEIQQKTSCEFPPQKK